MADDLDDFLNQLDSSGGDTGGASGKGLRAQLEAMLAKNKALEDQLAQVSKAQRSNALESLFTKHGVPLKARDFFPNDKDPSDETVTAFVEEYGDLWGASAAQATTPPAEQQATAAMQQFSSQASQPPVAPLSEEAYAAKFAEAKTKDEFLRMLSELSAAGE